MKKNSVIHFIGIGGAGMSALAELYHLNGYKVQGSDIKGTDTTDHLSSLGIKIMIGHSKENIEGVDTLIYSSCIDDVNPELKTAKRKDIVILKRMEALAMLFKDKDIIAVSGSHGKTTTSSLIAYLLIEAGLDPTVLIGANVSFLKGNARFGKSNIVVTEADESDGSFLLINPFYSVSTNVDKEHMDYYSSMDEVIRSYTRYIDNTKKEGCSFICNDDPNLRDIASRSDKKIFRYGFKQSSDITAINMKLYGINGSQFDIVYKGKVLGTVRLSITGIHNVLNSLSAIAVALELGVDFSLIQEKISNFRGASRRFQVTHLDSDILIIDDYAHHPTEIKATLDILNASNKRIIAVFQPHRYSRTKYLRDEFGLSFGAVDHLVITDIYSAHESPLDDVSAMDICERVKEGGNKNVFFVSKDNIVDHLTGIIRPGDAVFILGAGDIDQLPERVICAITAKEK